MGGARPLGWKAGAMEGSSGTQDSSCRMQPAGLLAYGVRVGKKTDCQVRPPAVPHIYNYAACLETRKVRAGPSHGV